MEIPGLIKDRLDLKILILYVLSQMPSPMELEELYEICLCDNGVSYFDYTDCLAELVSSGQVAESEEGYAITDKGRSNTQMLATSLPYSLRKAAERAAAPTVKRQHRNLLITTETLREETGISAHLAFNDGECTLLDLKLYCGDEETAKKLKKNFRAHAENIYLKLMQQLRDDTKEED